MIQANNVCLSFGEQKVFDNISFTVSPFDRIGLVGRNGSGKSTMLKAIAGMQHLDDGTVSIANKMTIAYMPQEVILDSHKPILEETLTACGDLVALQKEIADLEARMHHNPTQAEVERYAYAQAELGELNPARLVAQAQKILMGLGFNEAQLAKSVNELSVGWKMRIVLAQLLLKNADFYLFDEPTNHLDIVAKDWFLNFIKNAKFGFMLVSHERYFLDQVCTKILDLEWGKATFYNGNYSKYLTQKEYDMQMLASAHAQQQKEIKQKMAVIDKFRASAARSKQAQSMLKAVDKIERIEIPPAPKTMSFTFPPIVQPGRVVLTVENVGYAFNNRRIFKNASFQIERGEKVAVVAPNGVGKTTLFNTIIGQLPRQEGKIELGYNVHATIFAQDQTKSLNGDKSIMENVIEKCPKKTEGEIRRFLGAFLFSNDDVHKKVKVLSGGEKNRVGMVCVLLQDANFLLLDEPTNHLDIPSKENLLAALKAYKGTILFVSHDHDFINETSNRILELTPDGVHSYIGNYESYLYQKAHRESLIQGRAQAPAAQAHQPVAAQKKEVSDDTAKQIKRLEGKIAANEQKVINVQERLAKLEFGTSSFEQETRLLNKLKRELEEFAAEWERLHKE